MNSLPRPVLIGGCPGAGKTTVSRLLSAALPHSACIETDQFFDYVQDLIHPAEPASQRPRNLPASTSATSCLKASNRNAWTGP